MALVRRILLLAALSLTGIALLAPLAARSAAPAPVEVDEGLLGSVQGPRVAADRGTLSERGLPPTGGIGSPAELLEPVPLPTPASVTNEATIVTRATPPPPPPPPPPTASRPRSVTYSGDSVWDDLARCESGGNWSINTGNGYYGGLQFSYATWHDFGGGEFAEYPHQATKAEQIVVAERLRAVRGYQPWPACRQKLGLP
jgi:hypothetical protein